MAIKIHSTKDVIANGVKVVLYGASGTGKTVMATTAPNPIFVSAEKGLLSVSNLDIPYIEAYNSKELDEAYKYILNSEYETVIIDSLSEIVSVILSKIRLQMVKESKAGKIDGRQPYGKLAEKMGTMIRNFRDLDGKNVIFIAKEIKIYDDEGNISGYDAYLPGKVLPFDLPYLTDEVFCLQMNRKGERFVQTYTDYKRVCKDRSGKLDKEEKADFTYIFNKILGKK